MAPSEFWRMTPPETWVAINGYNDKYESDFHREWERIRWLGAIVARGWSKDKVDPKTLLPFPWEKEGSESTPERIEELRKEMGWEPAH